ncbi:MAG: gluconate 2-dehydrogenase subunit 3 family protein [Bryobacteraceae bacterium]
MSEDEKQQKQNERELQEEGVSRRSLFHILGAGPAVAALASRPMMAQVNEHHAHLPAAARAAVPAGPYQRKVFDDKQWRTVSILCDLVIPADERSGSATEAGVPEFIDDWIYFVNDQHGNRDFEAQILGGLMWLDRESNQRFEKPFADAIPDQQRQLLDRIAWPERASKEDHAGVEFFNHFRDLTVSGFFSSKMGVHDLPYLGNTAVAEWKGCDPKVWAIVEDRMKNGYKGVAGPEAKPWSA